MVHDDTISALLKRGIRPGLTAVHARELMGINAVTELAGAGECDPFPFTRGGKQGGVATTDEWNALIEHTLEPLVEEWSQTGSGIALFGHFVIMRSGWIILSHLRLPFRNCRL